MLVTVPLGQTNPPKRAVTDDDIFEIDEKIQELLRVITLLNPYPKMVLNADGTIEPVSIEGPPKAVQDLLEYLVQKRANLIHHRGLLTHQMRHQ